MPVAAKSRVQDALRVAAARASSAGERARERDGLETCHPAAGYRNQSNRQPCWTLRRTAEPLAKLNVYPLFCTPSCPAVGTVFRPTITHQPPQQFSSSINTWFIPHPPVLQWALCSSL